VVAVPTLGFFREEFFRLLRARQALLLGAVLLYAVLALPFLLARPPEEVVTGLRTWFGGNRIELKLFLFIWFDLTMNKLCALAGALLAAGIVTEERSRGTLDLLLAKPITPRRYFAVKLGAAAAVFVALYALTVLVGVVRFSLGVPGFDVGVFLLLSSVHLLAGLFGVLLAGTLAQYFRHKLTATLVTVVVLTLLVGAAFLGFYAPQWRAVCLLNPFFHGVMLVGAADSVRAVDAVAPVLWLLGFNALVVAVGVHRAASLLREE
jgi:ABC-2 type transport system permease protein